MSSDSHSAFAKVPDHVLAQVLAALDIKSRLRLASLCTRFWRVCFESHQPTVWRRVEISEYECFDLVKYEGVLHNFSDLVQSLLIDTDGLFSDFWDCLPVMNNVLYLNLREIDVVDEDNVHKMAMKFPALESISAKEARWMYDTLGITRFAFPHLKELEVGEMAKLERYELNDLIDTLQDLQNVRVSHLRVNIGDQRGLATNPIDSLAETPWAKSLRSLEINFWSSTIPPQTSVGDFEALEYLGVSFAGQRMIDWMSTIYVAPKLQNLNLLFCRGLEELWRREQCFPAGIKDIELRHCCVMNEWFINKITQHVTTLQRLVIYFKKDNPCQFNLSAALQNLLTADSRVANVSFVGPVCPPFNSEQELRLVYDNFMENPGALVNLKLLDLELDIILGPETMDVFKLQLDEECDLEALVRRLPNPETEIIFSFDQNLPAISE